VENKKERKKPGKKAKRWIGNMTDWTELNFVKAQNLAQNRH